MPDQKDIDRAAQFYKDAGITDPLATQLGTAYINLLYAGFDALSTIHLQKVNVSTPVSIKGIGFPATGPP